MDLQGMIPNCFLPVKTPAPKPGGGHAVKARKPGVCLAARRPGQCFSGVPPVRKVFSRG